MKTPYALLVLLFFVIEVTTNYTATISNNGLITVRNSNTILVLSQNVDDLEEGVIFFEKDSVITKQQCKYDNQNAITINNEKIHINGIFGCLLITGINTTLNTEIDYDINSKPNSIENNCQVFNIQEKEQLKVCKRIISSISRRDACSNITLADISISNTILNCTGKNLVFTSNNTDIYNATIYADQLILNSTDFLFIQESNIIVEHLIVQSGNQTIVIGSVLNMDQADITSGIILIQNSVLGNTSSVISSGLFSIYIRGLVQGVKIVDVNLRDTSIEGFSDSSSTGVEIQAPSSNVMEHVRIVGESSGGTGIYITGDIKFNGPNPNSMIGISDSIYAPQFAIQMENGLLKFDNVFVSIRSSACGGLYFNNLNMNMVQSTVEITPNIICTVNKAAISFNNVNSTIENNSILYIEGTNDGNIIMESVFMEFRYVNFITSTPDENQLHIYSEIIDSIRPNIGILNLIYFSDSVISEGFSICNISSHLDRANTFSFYLRGVHFERTVISQSTVFSHLEHIPNVDFAFCGIFIDNQTSATDCNFDSYVKGNQLGGQSIILQYDSASSNCTFSGELEAVGVPSFTLLGFLIDNHIFTGPSTIDSRVTSDTPIYATGLLMSEVRIVGDVKNQIFSSYVDTKDSRSIAFDVYDVLVFATFPEIYLSAECKDCIGFRINAVWTYLVSRTRLNILITNINSPNNEITYFELDDLFVDPCEVSVTFNNIDTFDTLIFYTKFNVLYLYFNSDIEISINSFHSESVSTNSNIYFYNFVRIFSIDLIQYQGSLELNNGTDISSINDFELNVNQLIICSQFISNSTFISLSANQILLQCDTIFNVNNITIQSSINSITMNDPYSLQLIANQITFYLGSDVSFHSFFKFYSFLFYLEYYLDRK